jgi:nitroimidazol reductase NimA-like FMN-containing flavoprotein (pyridoxamine 5'-phosphate oxidase superfamily)
MASPKAPLIRSLDRADCEAILERNYIGRLAFSFRDRVDIEPLHYVFESGWLVGRTSHGEKLSTLRHNPWVAFEVDEVDGLFEWRSVVAHGVFEILTADGPRTQLERWERAVDALRRLVPETGAADDPVAFRSVIFRVVIDSMTGRESR